MPEFPFFTSSPSEAMRNSLVRDAKRVIDSGIYVGGIEVQGFEKELATFLGGGYCVGVANGLDAITLSLLALNIGPGDDVLVPSYSFMATWIAVRRSGARCVAIDVDPKTGLVDPHQVLRKVSRKTKAFIPVHLYGNPFENLTLISELRGRGVTTLDDGAQSIGATFSNGEPCLAGDLIAYSFYPTKNLGALGDGGAVFTKNHDLAKKVRSLGSYGFGEARHSFDDLGLNSRLDSIQSAFLSTKLRSLENENRHRAQQREIYSTNLSEHVEFISSGPGSSNHHIAIKVRSREKLRQRLAKKGVSTDIHYPYTVELFASKSEKKSVKLKDNDFLGASELAKTVVTLPVGSWLSFSETAHIAEIIATELSDF